MEASVVEGIRYNEIVAERCGFVSILMSETLGILLKSTLVRLFNHLLFVKRRER